MTTKKANVDFDEQETVRRMNDALKRALSRPHQPHKANKHPDGSTAGPEGRVFPGSV